MANNNGSAKPISVNLITLDELCKLPPITMLGDTHFVAGGLNIVFGPSATYKSFYVLGHALKIAQTSSVAYIAAEGSSGLPARVKAWLGYNGLITANIHFACKEVNLLDSDETDGLALGLWKIRPSISLIIFDTYARCLIGGDENSARDAGLAIRNCATLQRKLNAAVLLVHHTNKAESSERGSGALRGGADSMIEIQSTDQDIRVQCSKMKDKEPWPTEVFRFQRYNTSGLLLPADKVASTTSLHPHEFKVLNVLTYSVFDSSGATTRQIIDAAGIPVSSVYKILSKLKTEMRVHQDKKGDPYSITQTGMIAFNDELLKQKMSVNSSNQTSVNSGLSDSQPTIN